MTKRINVFYLWTVLAFVLASCAAPQKKETTDPQSLFSHACGTGGSVTEVNGSVWMKAKSEEASGQFPAVVNVKDPDHLDMEVTNLLGGTEAQIKIRGRKYEVDIPGQKAQSQKGADSWGGIPLKWATELFLGRVPCPKDIASQELKMSIINGDELMIEVPASLDGAKEQFVYQFRAWEGKPWPEKLHWEREGPVKVAVDFEFNKPESKTRSPLKWKAKSSQGEVKVRWKQRDLKTN